MAQTNNPLRIWSEYLLAYGLLGALRRLPLPVADALARAASQVLDIGIPKLRRVGLQNLSFAMPHLGTREHHRLIDGVFESVARLLVTIARLPSINARNVSRWICYEGLEHYQHAKWEARGVLIATAHLGNWELSAFAHALLVEPMHVMIRPLDNPFIDRIVEYRRTLSGNRVIDKRDAARAVLKALRNNQAVGVLVDQNTAAVEGVFIDFFGKLACAGTGFVKLAHRSGAPVIPGFALWDKRARRYVLRFYPRVEMTGDIQRDTQRLHSTIEGIIREYPDQWMWIHRRWKTRPPGEAALY